MKQEVEEYLRSMLPELPHHRRSPVLGNNCAEENWSPRIDHRIASIEHYVRNTDTPKHDLRSVKPILRHLHHWLILQLMAQTLTALCWCELCVKSIGNSLCHCLTERQR